MTQESDDQRGAAMPAPRPLGQVVRSIRRGKLHMTRAQFAKKTNLPLKTIEDIETVGWRTNRHEVTFRTLRDSLKGEVKVTEEDLAELEASWNASIQSPAPAADPREVKQRRLERLLAELHPDARLVDRKRLTRLIRRLRSSRARISDQAVQLAAIQSQLSDVQERLEAVRGQSAQAAAETATEVSTLRGCFAKA